MSKRIVKLCHILLALNVMVQVLNQVKYKADNAIHAKSVLISTLRTYSLKIKRFAVYLYLKRMTMRSIAKVLGLSSYAVHCWIIEQASLLEDDTKQRFIAEVEVDEMWHYLGKKR